MFVGHRIPIELKSEKEMHHTLLFHFRSAFLIGKQLEAKHGKLVLYNGDSSRLYVRKAGYHCKSSPHIPSALLTIAVIDGWE